VHVSPSPTEPSISDESVALPKKITSIICLSCPLRSVRNTFFRYITRISSFLTPYAIKELFTSIIAPVERELGFDAKFEIGDTFGCCGDESPCESAVLKVILQGVRKFGRDVVPCFCILSYQSILLHYWR